MLVRIALRNVFRNFRRTTIAVTAVAIGTGGLIMFRGFNQGIFEAAREHAVHSRFGNGQINTVGYRDMVLEKPWRYWIENADEVRTFLRTLPHVHDAFPRVRFTGLLTMGDTSIGGLGVGIDGAAEEKFFTSLSVDEGRVLGSRRDGIVLGHGLAESLAATVGDQVTLITKTIDGAVTGMDFVVQGITRTGLAEIDDVVFFVQLDATLGLLETRNIEMMAVGLDSYDPKDWEVVALAVSARFSQLEATSFEVLDRVWYGQLVAWLNQQYRVIELVILFIVLLSIFGTASSTILERAREWGTLGAHGESFLDMMRLLLWEGFFLATLGGLLGVVVALTLKWTVLSGRIAMPSAPGYTICTDPLIILQWPAVAASFGVCVVATVVATLLAGVRVLRMPLGQALRADGR